MIRDNTCVDINLCNCDGYEDMKFKTERTIVGAHGERRQKCADPRKLQNSYWRRSVAPLFF